MHVKPGVAITKNGKPVETAELRSDSRDDRLTIGDLQLWVHASGGRFAIRLRDKNSKLRQNFTGLRWFPVDESYRVTARYTPYEKEKQVDIQNLAGDAVKLPISGYVTFTLRGQALRLEAQVGRQSGGALICFSRPDERQRNLRLSGAFSTPIAVKSGEVVLDFNEAYNPPCAYNPYTTCPIPPPENRLRARIEAGEMSYKHDH